jgi:hypothetical protein
MLEVEKSIPSPSAIPTYYGHNRSSLLYLLDKAGHGISGVVKDQNSGEALSATIFVTGSVGDLYPVFSDSVNGDFQKIVLPGEYRIKVVANGYETLERDIVVDGAEAITLLFELTQITSDTLFAVKAMTCKVPGAFNVTPAVKNYTGDLFQALGRPDGKRFSLGSGSYISLGGSITLDFGETVYDRTGVDLVVIEGDDTPEGYTVKTSTDWITGWQTVGKGMGTTSFDLSDSGITGFRYVKIEDDFNDSSDSLNHGVDIDAVYALKHKSGVSVQNGTEVPSVSTALTVMPNPFNPSTTIQVHLPDNAPASYRIYAVNGTLIYEFEMIDKGTHRIVWNGRNSDGLPVSCGVYMGVLYTGAGKTKSHLLFLTK